MAPATSAAKPTFGLPERKVSLKRNASDKPEVSFAKQKY